MLLQFLQQERKQQAFSYITNVCTHMHTCMYTHRLLQSEHLTMSKSYFTLIILLLTTSLSSARFLELFTFWSITFYDGLSRRHLYQFWKHHQKESLAQIGNESELLWKKARYTHTRLNTQDLSLPFPLPCYIGLRGAPVCSSGSVIHASVPWLKSDLSKKNVCQCPSQSSQMFRCSVLSFSHFVLP